MAFTHTCITSLHAFWVETKVLGQVGRFWQNCCFTKNMQCREAMLMLQAVIGSGLLLAEYWRHSGGHLLSMSSPVGY